MQTTLFLWLFPWNEFEMLILTETDQSRVNAVVSRNSDKFSDYRNNRILFSQYYETKKSCKQALVLHVDSALVRISVSKMVSFEYSFHSESHSALKSIR